MTKTYRYPFCRGTLLIELFDNLSVKVSSRNVDGSLGVMSIRSELAQTELECTSRFIFMPYGKFAFTDGMKLSKQETQMVTVDDCGALPPYIKEEIERQLLALLEQFCEENKSDILEVGILLDQVELRRIEEETADLEKKIAMMKDCLRIKVIAKAIWIERLAEKKRLKHCLEEE